MKCPICGRDNLTEQELSVHIMFYHKEKQPHQPQVQGVCPDCGATLMMQEGCSMCHSCGYSKC